MVLVKERGKIQLFHLGEVKAERDMTALSKTIRGNTREEKKAFELYNTISTKPL